MVTRNGFLAVGDAGTQRSQWCTICLPARLARQPVERVTIARCNIMAPGLFAEIAKFPITESASWPLFAGPGR